MDGLTLLAEARAAGLKVKAQGERLVIQGPKQAEPIARRLIEHKAELLALLARRDQYRTALRRWWTLTAQGPEADREAIGQTYQETLRLLDEVGEPTATQLRREWAREWWRQTRVCPYCGEAGPFHDPDPECPRSEDRP